MIQSALELFREHGYSGTGFRDIVEHSGAPRGSIYHYFPDGKAQLGAEAVALAGEFIARRMDKAMAAEDPAQALDAFFGWWMRLVTRDEFRKGCPVVAVAAESQTDAPELRAAAASAFGCWEEILVKGFRREGLSMARSRDLAALWIGALEGATVMSRATADDVPMERTRRELKRIVASALSEASG